MRKPYDDEGFTLIELMVVVLIIGVLVAVGLPMFLGARTRAQDGAAKTLIRQGLSAQLVHYGNALSFTDDDPTLEAIEPDIAWGTLEAPDKGVIASVAGGGNAVILRSESGDGTVFCIARIANGAGAGTYYTTGCTGAEAVADIAGWPSTVATGW